MMGRTVGVRLNTDRGGRRPIAGIVWAPLLTLVQRSFDPLFTFYVFLLILLPSGTLFGVNIKTICFALIVPSAVLRFTGDRRTTSVQVGVLFAVPSLLLAWTLLSQLYGYDLMLALAQGREILITLVSCWLAAVGFGTSEARKLKYLRTLLRAETVACLVKVGLLAYSFYKGVPVSLIVDSISAFFGVPLMGMDFEEALGRIQFIADGIIPVLLYLLLLYRHRLRLSVTWSVVLFLLMTLSLIFTFSRYFWGFGMFAVCVGLLAGKKDRFQGWLLALAALIVLVCLPQLVTLYDLRFSAAIAGGSDTIRTQQIPSLVRFFFDAPLFGHGFGTYTPEVIRSVETPYGYEVQLYAMAGQEGVVGLLLMALLTGYYFRDLWVGDRRSLIRRLNLLLILIAWLCAGLFNPMLLNSAAAMSYAAMRAMAGLQDDKAEQGGGALAERGAEQGAALEAV